MNSKSWFVITGLALIMLASSLQENLAASAEQRAALETVTLDVPSMTCASCPFIVTKTLQGVPGVTEAAADFDTKTATVAFDKEKTDISALIEALKNRGYSSTVRDSS